MNRVSRIRRARLERLEDRRLLAAQVFTPTNLNIGATTVTFDVVYSVLDDNGEQDDSIRTNGVSLRLHYDTAELTPDLDAIIASTFGTATVQDVADTADFDADPATDRFINWLWFDVDGQFPRDATLPLELFTADFDIAGALAGVPTIDLTGSPPPGFDFVRVPLGNNPWQNPVNRFDVDHLGTVTALDALLIINELKARKVSEPLTGRLVNVPPDGFAPPFYDVNGDGNATALDALQIINQLSRLAVVNPPGSEDFPQAVSPPNIDAVLAQWMRDQDERTR